MEVCFWIFAAKFRFGSVYVVIMSYRKQREQAGGVGCSGAKVGNAVKRRTMTTRTMRTNGRRMTTKRPTEVDRHIGKMYVAIWPNIDKEEAYKRSAEIMTADFDVAGGPMHTWGTPCFKKLGPFSYRNVSVYLRFFWI